MKSCEVLASSLSFLCIFLWYGMRWSFSFSELEKINNLCLD